MRHDFLRTPLSIALILGMTVSSAFAVEKGESNPKNNTRSVGPAGPQGKAGPQGLQGVAGSKGDTGLQGPIGLAGAAGPVGATGPSSGYVLLDANNNIIGPYIFSSSSTILEINKNFYQVPVTSTGFTTINNYIASTNQTYFTSNDCSGTAYYGAPNFTNLNLNLNPFPSQIITATVYSNKLYKLDTTQIVNITANSMHSPGYLGTNCGNQTQDLYGGSFFPTLVTVIPSSGLILIEDLSIYPTPFSIKAR